MLYEVSNNLPTWLVIPWSGVDQNVARSEVNKAALTKCSLSLWVNSFRHFDGLLRLHFQDPAIDFNWFSLQKKALELAWISGNSMSIDASHRYTSEKTDYSSYNFFDSLKSLSAVRKPRICFIILSSRPVDCTLNHKTAVRYHDVLRSVILR